MNDEVRDLTSSPSMTERLWMISSVSPSDEVLAVWVGAQILERQDCNRRRLRCPPERAGADARCNSQDGSNRDVSPPSPGADRGRCALVDARSHKRSELGTQSGGTVVPISGFGSSARSTMRTNALGRSGRVAASSVRVPWA